LKGSVGNRNAIGARVEIIKGEELKVLEYIPSKGFQSSVSSILHFGIGNWSSIDKVIVYWPDGKETTLLSPKINERILIDYSNLQGSTRREKDKSVESSFSIVDTPRGLDWKHKENKFSDFDRDRLIFQMNSTEGAKPSVGDVNGDGMDDIFFPGAKEQESSLYLQNRNGSFSKKSEDFKSIKRSESVSSLFFDADGDKDLDLYVVNGGYEFSQNSIELSDRIFFNDGKGNFKRQEKVYPNNKFEYTSCVAASDIDNDGDLDLFVGGRLVPYKYGLATSSYILLNDGNGNFENANTEIAKELEMLGMVKSAVWTDYDGDKDEDLIVAGEWMPIVVFKNANGTLVKQNDPSLKYSSGWWNSIEETDLNGDDLPDYFLGNHGLNSRFRASAEKPISLLVSDFDNNGSIEQILSQFNGSESYPLCLRHDLVKQLPNLKKRFLKYEDFKNETVHSIFTAEELAEAKEWEVFTLATSFLLNRGNGEFELVPLKTEAQLGPTYSIYIDDESKFAIGGGNLFNVKPEIGRFDAHRGFAIDLSSPDFNYLGKSESGIDFDGEVRSIDAITIKGKSCLVVSRNNDSPIFLTTNK